MKNLFSRKQKTFLAFCFFIVTIVIPQTTFASWYNPFSWGADIGTVFANVGLAIMFVGPFILTSVASIISGFILGVAIHFANIQSYTNSLAVQTGWPIVRNLGNMIIVLGFVVIGIATALRIKTYQASQLLAKLIVVALLINFSKLLCGVWIDGTNIIMNYFFGQIGNISSWFPGASNIGSLFSEAATHSPMDFGPILIGLIIFNAIATFLYLVYALVILLRVLAIWVLVILSPLAFVCYVFPATKNVWDMWWKNFFQWTIIIIPLGLFYYVGGTMISQLTLSPNNDVGALLANGMTTAGWQAYITNMFSVMLVPGLLLIVGFIVSLQFAPMGAKAIMDFAKKNASKVTAGGLGMLNAAHMATTGKFLGAAGNKFNQMAAARGGQGVIGKGAGWMAAGANALANPVAQSQKTKSLFGRGLERVGAIPEGTMPAYSAKILKENQSRAEALINQGRQDRVEEMIGSGDSREVAAGIGALLETGKFDIKKQKHREGLSVFQGEGGSLAKYKEKNRALAGEDIAAIKNRATSEGISIDAAKVKEAEGAYKDMGARALTGLKAKEINEHSLSMTSPTLFDATSDKLSPEVKSAYAKMAKPGTDEYKARVAKRQELYKSADPADHAKAQNMDRIITMVRKDPTFKP